MKSSSRRSGGKAAKPAAHADSAPEPAMPASVSAAWGLRQAASRPRKHGLSLARIVDAGIRVATVDGLAAVSMNRVAAELGAATMSLYRHVGAKDELLAHMVDAALGDPPAAPGRGESWRDGLARWATAHLTVLRRHPWVVRVPIGGPPLMPNQVRWFERGLACLRDTGLAPAEQPSVLLLINGFVRNQATLEADLTHAAHAAGVAPADVGRGYSDVLARITDAERYPSIHALLRAKVFIGEGALADDFRFGLDRLLDGIGALIATRAREARSRR